MSGVGGDGIQLSVKCYLSQQSWSDCFQRNRRLEVSEEGVPSLAVDKMVSAVCFQSPGGGGLPLCGRPQFHMS